MSWIVVSTILLVVAVALLVKLFEKPVTPRRHCNKCGAELSSEELLYCNTCMADAYKVEALDDIAASMSTYKVCRVCHISKPEKEFAIVSTKNGKTYRRTVCKTCYNQRRREQRREKRNIIARNAAKRS